MNKNVKNDDNSIMIGGDSDKNRLFVESKNTRSIILNHNLKDAKDSLYERDSGLNHIICRFAKEKNITFIIDLDELWNDYSNDLFLKARVFSRVMQNLRLFNKFKNSLKVMNLNGRTPREVQNLLITLGLNTSLSNSAVKNAS
ncbi:hypothetical protein COU61_01230 [Candidatus Pacearchaeota archaeon CG10_big_fil_rev_8_21_14_0_10_35_13]|nr:MAG: hypothetical protein COU61_01230 [Candidatus Pacearchaeota archaeon CG10_big_fil_rev_8_21_14_0_10_35_13]